MHIQNNRVIQVIGYSSTARLTWIKEQRGLPTCVWHMKIDWLSLDKHLDPVDVCICDGCRLRCMRTGGMTDC